MEDHVIERPGAAGDRQPMDGRDSSDSLDTDELALATDRRSAEGLHEHAPELSQEPESGGEGAEEPEEGAGQQSRLLGGIRELVETAVLALLFFFALRAVVQNFRVEGSSMVPSFTDGQYVLVNKAVYAHANSGSVPVWVPLLGGQTGSSRYLFHPPERGDVIVFHPPPPNDPRRDFIKRVIGVPGDTVDIRQGHAYVNGAELAESYIRQPTLPINIRFAHVALGADQYFVLGDNRGNSSDSRAWGPVSSDEIVGRTWLIYWPADSIKVAPNHSERVAAPQAAAATPQP